MSYKWNRTVCTLQRWASFTHQNARDSHTSNSQLSIAK